MCTKYSLSQNTSSQGMSIEHGCGGFEHVGFRVQNLELSSLVMLCVCTTDYFSIVQQRLLLLETTLHKYRLPYGTERSPQIFFVYYLCIRSSLLLNSKVYYHALRYNVFTLEMAE